MLLRLGIVVGLAAVSSAGLLHYSRRSSTPAGSAKPIPVTMQVASPGVLEVVFDVGPLDSAEHRPPDTSVQSWRVNQKAPKAVYRYSAPHDELKEDRGHYPIVVRHHIYLDLGEPLVTGRRYAVEGPSGSQTLTFDEGKTRCTAIKVNQVGYNAAATSRYANIGVFLGDGGSRELTPTPRYSVRDAKAGRVIFEGASRYMGDDTDPEPVESSGEHVYRLPLDTVPVGGPYFVSVPGCGRSPDFGIGPEYSAQAARVITRGMYHQRCGIALDKAHTEYTRAACHPKVAFTRSPQEGWIKVPEGAEMHSVTGGYHDAGDFDRRPMHTIIPILMLAYYEAFPSHFVDRQYNIPESGNGIADFLDEALWSLQVWQGLQITDPKDAEVGGVMSATETKGHPGYGEQSAANDSMVFGTRGVTAEVTALAAGFFAHAARLLAPHDTKRAATLASQSRNAWKYIERNVDLNTPQSDTMYAALQLYLLDRSPKHREIFERMVRQIVLRSGGAAWPHTYNPGNTSATCQTAHFVSYLLQPGAADPALLSDLKERILGQAERGTYHGPAPEPFPYPQGVTKFIGWGASTAQGRYADVYCFAHLFATDPVKRQAYFNAASQYADYALGLNPLGMSYVTGLGTDQVQSPTHLDSYYTKYGLTDGVTNDHVGKPKGNVPGILIYGPAQRSKAPYQRAVADLVYPEWKAMPGQRRWADGWSLINGNEFTVWETNVWAVVLHGFLYDASADKKQAAAPGPAAPASP